MSDQDLYETDILAWTEQQAAALRDLAGRRDLPNTLDLPHVAEEIEDMGQSALNAVKSFIRLILGHGIKCWADPNAPSTRHWLAEIGHRQSGLLDRLTPSMHAKIDMDVLWRRAVRQAVLDLAAQGRDAAAQHVRSVLVGSACPLTLLLVCDEDGAIQALLDRLPPASPLTV